MRDDGGGGGQNLDVDPDRMRALGLQFDGVVRDLLSTHEEARDAVLAGYGAAIPPSDLRSALGFCWGRWSQVLLDAENALRFTATVAAQAAGSFERTDRGLTL